MQAFLSKTQEGSGTTYRIALFFLGTAAVAQLVLAGVAYGLRHAPRSAVGAGESARPVMDVAQQEQALLRVEPGAALDLPSFVPPETPPAGPPKPTPISTRPVEQIVRPVAKPVDWVTALVEKARALRDAGDTNSALVKLREAQALASDNALVISEIALTYEAMGLKPKADEQWSRIRSMGSAAGALGHVAELKLSPPAEKEETTALPGRDSQGLQPGSALGLIDVRLTQEADATAIRKHRLRLGIKARQGEVIDGRSVVIQVFFYDQLAGEHVVQTNAEVGSEWTTVPTDWADDGIEVLEVSYRQPAPEAGTAPEDRKYYGYLIRLYYKGQLQDVRAEPVRLLSLYPPPLQLDQAQ